MPIFECDCGLIISTSSDRAQCLRCSGPLGQTHRLHRINTVSISDTVVIAIRTERVLGDASSRATIHVRSAGQTRIDL
jgi:hypothetical protein